MIEQHGSLAEKFIKKWFWLYVFSYLAAPIWYLIKVILSWEIEVYEMGILYGVMSLMVLANSFNDMWMWESLNKFIPQFITENRYDKVKTVLFYALVAQIITGWILFLVFFLWADFLALHYFKSQESIKVVQIFSFFFLGISFFQVLLTFFQSVQNTLLQKWSEFLRMIFVLIFITYMYATDMGNLVYFSLSWVLWLYVWMIFSIIFFYKKYYRPYLTWVPLVHSTQLLKEVFSYAVIVFLWSQAATILGQIDMQMIIYMLWNQDAGYYTNYLNLISIPFTLIWPILFFLFPVFSQMVVNQEHHKITLIKSIFTKNLVSFSIAFSILFFVFALPIAVFFFWEKYLISWDILQYSILFLVFNFLLQINFNILAANGKVVQRLRIILIAIVINTILNYIFIKTIWVVWAALTTGMGWILIYILSEIQLKEYHQRFDWLYLGKNTIIFWIIWVLMYFYLLPEIIELWRMQILFALVIISIIYFWLYIWVNKNDFLYFYKEIKKLRKSKKAS